ncbi:hypothetical protein PQS31_06245 [Luteimonas sp BLCC-B24]|uniref:phage tail tube protein n=1 Tax=Luteimonas sp. BLCC-B24 TaxID=3025317 RepID=UPI00234C79F1|nr:hypothetical protein [Luteimonas sp. BLCC-B24]MDC7806424.1 hypothetical protein [Luteimonas sp. BLCC-B24]
MAQPKVRQFAGDFRMWRLAPDRSLIPVIPEPTDPYGNQPIETNLFQFGYEPGDEVTINSKRRGGRYNQPIHSDQLPGATSLSIQLQELPTAILARILRGQAADAAVSAGTVTDEAFTVASASHPIQLEHVYVSSVVVTKGGTPLVAGTDYTADLRRGQVLPKAGGSIEAGDALSISYSYAAVNGTLIQGGATPLESFYISGDLEDRISGEDGELTVYEARLGVEDDIDWLATEPLSPTLTGNLLVPAGAPAPYTFRVYEQAA